MWSNDSLADGFSCRMQMFGMSSTMIRLPTNSALSDGITPDVPGRW